MHCCLCMRYGFLLSVSLPFRADRAFNHPNGRNHPVHLPPDRVAQILLQSFLPFEFLQ